MVARFIMRKLYEGDIVKEIPVNKDVETRIAKAINHIEPDRVPIDLGSIGPSGISAIAYNKYGASNAATWYVPVRYVVT